MDDACRNDAYPRSSDFLLNRLASLVSSVRSPEAPAGPGSDDTRAWSSPTRASNIRRSRLSWNKRQESLSLRYRSESRPPPAPPSSDPSDPLEGRCRRRDTPSKPLDDRWGLSPNGGLLPEGESDESWGALNP